METDDDQAVQVVRAAEREKDPGSKVAFGVEVCRK